MENPETTLVIILSVTLTVFLIVAIILFIWLIKLAKVMNRVAVKAEDVVDNVETASSVLKNAAGSMATGKFLMNIFDVVLNKRKGGK